MAIDPHDVRTSLGRNLTYGMLDSLGKAIVTGAYEETPFPTEAELSKQHAVSRSVTREAVKMLTAKGLLSARPRQGTIVQPVSSWNLFDADVLRWLLDRKFSVDLLRQFSELRIAIEPAAAALAARAADDEGLAGIRAGFDRMAAAGCPDLTITDVLVLHHICHRARNKKLADICFVLNVEDTHVVGYSLKKLLAGGLAQGDKVGKEVFYSPSPAGAVWTS